MISTCLPWRCYFTKEPHPRGVHAAPTLRFAVATQMGRYSLALSGIGGAVDRLMSSLIVSSMLLRVYSRRTALPLRRDFDDPRLCPYAEQHEHLRCKPKARSLTFMETFKSIAADRETHLPLHAGVRAAA